MRPAMQKSANRSFPYKDCIRWSSCRRVFPQLNEALSNRTRNKPPVELTLLVSTTTKIGLIYGDLFGWEKILKECQGFLWISLIGSLVSVVPILILTLTGFESFVKPKEPLHRVSMRCLFVSRSYRRLFLFGLYRVLFGNKLYNQL